MSLANKRSSVQATITRNFFGRTVDLRKIRNWRSQRKDHALSPETALFLCDENQITRLPAVPRS